MFKIFILQIWMKISLIRICVMKMRRLCRRLQKTAKPFLSTIITKTRINANIFWFDRQFIILHFLMLCKMKAGTVRTNLSERRNCRSAMCRGRIHLWLSAIQEDLQYADAERYNQCKLPATLKTAISFSNSQYLIHHSHR